MYGGIMRINQRNRGGRKRRGIKKIDQDRMEVGLDRQVNLRMGNGERPEQEKPNWTGDCRGGNEK